MKRRSYRFIAIAMTFMMASSSFTVAAPKTVAFAAEQAVHNYAPKQYLPSDVVPMKDEAQITKVVNALVKAMTEDEKWGFLALTATGTEGNAGDLPGVARLGVPRIKMYDGPAGLLYLYETTNVPEEELLAATWSEEMANLYGTVYSTENNAMGGAAMLSAQLDIQRHPFWNRTKDQMGADSYLLSDLADDLVQGMQSKGGLANLKHFAVCSDEGKLMNNVRELVDEQTLHETYLPGFESAIKNGGAMSVMSGYNMLNGKYASDDDYTLKEVLRDQWNFTGFTITDWGGNHSFTLDNGTDIEAPKNNNNNKKNAQTIVASGAAFTLTELNVMVDTSVTRILRAYAVGGYLSLVNLDENGNVIEYEVADDAPTSKRATSNSSTGYEIVKVIDTVADVDLLASAVSDNQEKVETIAEEGMVLLKNQDLVLPIATDGSQKVSIVGTNGTTLISGIGGERSYGATYQMKSPYQAMVDIMGDANVKGYSYEEVIGTVIPNEYLYTTGNGTEHGATRSYGTGSSSGDVVYENGQYHSNSTSQTQMPNHEIGEFCKVDETIDFTTDKAPSNYTYKYADGSNLKNEFGYDAGAAYTWNTYVEAPEDGDFKLVLHSIGASASMTVYKLNVSGSAIALTAKGNEIKYGSASGGTDNQGTNWFNSTMITKTGQNVSSVSVKNATKGTRYCVTISSAAKFKEKDMQVSLAWVTPSAAKNAKEGAIAEAKKPNTTSVVFAYAGTESVGSTLEETSLKLDASQQQMIIDVADAAHAAGNKVVVALQSPQQVVMEDWIDKVDGIVLMYYAGQRGGAAIANILTGKVNPSGHLAYTIPKKDTDTILTYSQKAFDSFKNNRDLTDEEIAYDKQGSSWSPSGGMGGFPGMGGSTGESDPDEYDPNGSGASSGMSWGNGSGAGANQTNEIDYSEGIFTDYRFFDKYGITPQYDFGYGLSYTTFAYSNVEVKSAVKTGERVGYDVSLRVTNTGTVAGKDVAQIYLGAANVPSNIQMAEKQLAGFQKTEELAPGQSQDITIHVSERSLSYWDENASYITRGDGTKDKWTVAEGNRTIYVGTAEDNFISNREVTVSLQSVNTNGGSTYVPVTDTTNKDSSTNKDSNTTGKDATQTTTLPQKDAVVQQSGVKYIVTKSDAENGTVSYVALTNSKKTIVTIPAVVTIDGTKFKVTSIAASAFKNNDTIKKVTIGTNVMTIGAEAFKGCDNLSTVIIAKNVKKIGKKAFAGCGKLSMIKLNSAMITSIDAGAFQGIADNATIKVPEEKFDAYKKMIKNSKVKAGIKITK